MIDISKYLDPQLVTFLDVEVKTRDDALKAIVELVYKSKKIDDKDFFYKAILEREKIVSTGIGMGVAIPHAKLSTIDHFFLGIGILQKGVVWDALDGAAVRLIFLIGGPDDKPTEYLQILSAVTNIIKNEDKRKKLLTMNSPEDILKEFMKK